MTPIHYGKENYDNFANVVMIILKNMVTKMTKDKYHEFLFNRYSFLAPPQKWTNQSPPPPSGQ